MVHQATVAPSPWFASPRWLPPPPTATHTRTPRGPSQNQHIHRSSCGAGNFNSSLLLKTFQSGEESRGIFSDSCFPPILSHLLSCFEAHQVVSFEMIRAPLNPVTCKRVLFTLHFLLWYKKKATWLLNSEVLVFLCTKATDRWAKQAHFFFSSDCASTCFTFVATPDALKRNCSVDQACSGQDRLT